MGKSLWDSGYGSGSDATSVEGPDLVNLLLLPFEILPPRFEVLSLIESGLGVRSQFVQLVLERKVTP